LSPPGRRSLHPQLKCYRLFFFAALAPSFPSAVRVRLGRWATVRFFFAVLAAFLILRRAALFCLLDVIDLPIKLSQLRPTSVARLLRVDVRSRVADPGRGQRPRLHLFKGTTGSFVTRGKFPKDDYLQRNGNNRAGDRARMGGLDAADPRSRCSQNRLFHRSDHLQDVRADER